MVPFYKLGKLFAYNVIDDHFRYNLAAVISDNLISTSKAETLENLVMKHGVPEVILHDTGPLFVSSPSNKITENFKAFLNKY